jgi:hypothetical protein
MTAALLLAALLSLSDPSGDAVGNGSLSPPTAVVFRSQDALDARALEVPKGRTFGFDLTFAHLSNPWNLPNGFSLPLIEVYLETKEPGQRALLPGSGMHLPASAHWNYAFKLTGDSFQVFQANPAGGGPSNISEQAAAKVKTQGNTVVASTNLPLPRHFELYAMVGSYDPFSQTGWRPVARQPSPWAYASKSQKVPVVDVLASTFALQERAVNSITLPPISTPPGVNRWPLLMGVGVLLFILGLIGRFWVKPRPQERAERKPAYVPVAHAHTIPPLAPAGFRAPPVVTVREKRLEAPLSFDSDTESEAEVLESIFLPGNDVKALPFEPNAFNPDNPEPLETEVPEDTPAAPVMIEETEAPPATDTPDTDVTDIRVGVPVNLDTPPADTLSAEAQIPVETPEAPNDMQNLPPGPNAADVDDMETLEAEDSEDAPPEEEPVAPALPDTDISSEETVNVEAQTLTDSSETPGDPKSAKEQDDTEQSPKT